MTGLFDAYTCVHCGRRFRDQRSLNDHRLVTQHKLSTEPSTGVCYQAPDPADPAKPFANGALDCDDPDLEIRRMAANAIVCPERCPTCGADPGAACLDRVSNGQTMWTRARKYPHAARKRKG